MGLVSLKSKINAKLNQASYSEEGVLYLLVELGKYLERSGKGFDDPDDIKLEINDYPVIMFFRNWVAHTEINRTIPENVLKIFKKILNKQAEEAEKELLELLENEIKIFCNAIGNGEIKINWENFYIHLMGVLSEQPVKVMPEGKYVGYNKHSLSLEEINI